VAALAAGLLGVVAAGTVATASTPSEPVPPSGDAATDASSAADAFPITIEHKYGSTEIAEVPERIVVVGLLEQDALLALGVAPVATTEWFGGFDGALWPWAQDAAAEIGVDAADITVLDAADGVAVEAVAAAEPDLILGLYSGLTDVEYELLSGIAPTVAQPAEYNDWGIPWQELTLTVGRIVGRSADAEALVADVEAGFAAAREAHPEFAGASGAVATPYEGIFVYGPQDVRGRFLADLGIELPEELATQLGEEFGGQLSLERVDLLDLDVVIWLDVPPASPDLDEGAYGALAVHQEGREVFLDSEAEDALGGAMSFVTVLSLPYLLDGVVPAMALAIDGDPATTAYPDAAA
jgi:iron complex transport system substrate-binding protein